MIFAGKVQGVFFRANTERRAIDLGITGWVRNTPEGTVEAVFEGEKDKVQDLITWCGAHQPHARVKDTDVTWEEYQNEFHGFTIRYLK